MYVHRRSCLNTCRHPQPPNPKRVLLVVSLRSGLPAKELAPPCCCQLHSTIARWLVGSIYGSPSIAAAPSVIGAAWPYKTLTRCRTPRARVTTAAIVEATSACMRLSTSCMHWPKTSARTSMPLRSWLLGTRPMVGLHHTPHTPRLFQHATHPYHDAMLPDLFVHRCLAAAADMDMPPPHHPCAQRTSCGTHTLMHVLRQRQLHTPKP